MAVGSLVFTWLIYHFWQFLKTQWVRKKFFLHIFGLCHFVRRRQIIWPSASISLPVRRRCVPQKCGIVGSGLDPPTLQGKKLLLIKSSQQAKDRQMVRCLEINEGGEVEGQLLMSSVWMENIR